MSVAASPAGARFATLERTGTLRFWEPPATEPSGASHSAVGAVNTVDGRVAFHPQGGMLAVSGGREWSARFFNAASGELIGKLPSHDDVRPRSPSARTARSSPLGTQGGHCGSGTSRRSHPERSSRPMTAKSPASPFTRAERCSHPPQSTVRCRIWETASRTLARDVEARSSGLRDRLQSRRDPPGHRLQRQYDPALGYHGISKKSPNSAVTKRTFMLSPLARTEPDSCPGSGDFTVRIWEDPDTHELPQTRRSERSTSASTLGVSTRKAVHGPSRLNKRHELQPHIVHRDVVRSEVKSFQIAIGDLPTPGLAGRSEPSCK